MNELKLIAETLPFSLTVIIVSVILLEWIMLSIANKIEKPKEIRVSFISAMLVFLPQFVFGKLFFIVGMFWCYEYRLFDLGFDWYVWILAWILYDFVWWFVHMIDHKVRILWCLHSVHHTSEEMNLSAGFRGSFLDIIISPLNTIWLPIFGFHPFMILIVDALGKFYGVYVHVNGDWVSDKKRKSIEKVLITPSAHRVHHSTNHAYLDMNFGETLSIWDRIFGTYQKEIAIEKPIYGVMKDIDSEDLYEVQFDELGSLWKDIKSTNSWSDKIKYIFMPPGWNHLDGGVLANELRSEALAKFEAMNVKHD